MGVEAGTSIKLFPSSSVQIGVLGSVSRFHPCLGKLDPAFVSDFTHNAHSECPAFKPSKGHGASYLPDGSNISLSRVPRNNRNLERNIFEISDVKDIGRSGAPFFRNGLASCDPPGPLHGADNQFTALVQAWTNFCIRAFPTPPNRLEPSTTVTLVISSHECEGVCDGRNPRSNRSERPSGIHGYL